MNKKMNRKGFTMVELIVVIAILAVLVGVGGPMYMRTMRIRQQQTCMQNRQMMMDIYERCLVEEWKAFGSDTLEEVCKGNYDKVKWEIGQYNKCPLSGTYSYTVSGHKATITCNHSEHSDVVELEWQGWGGTDPAESDDNPVP